MVVTTQISVCLYFPFLFLICKTLNSSADRYAIKSLAKKGTFYKKGQTFDEKKNPARNAPERST